MFNNQAIFGEYLVFPKYYQNTFFLSLCHHAPFFSRMKIPCLNTPYCDCLLYLTTKTFITIPSTCATPKPLYAIRSGRQRALAPCDQLNLRNSRSKSGRQKSIPVTIVINSAITPRRQLVPPKKPHRVSSTTYIVYTLALKNTLIGLAKSKISDARPPRIYDARACPHAKSGLVLAKRKISDKS